MWFPALIARLGQEEMKRIKRAIGETLFKLTGQSYYDLADLWLRWWQEHGESFVVPADVPERKVRKDGRRTVATFYGVPVESDRVVFVLDHSGSMGSKRTEGGTDFDKAVAETLEVAAKLEAGAKLNVILFETSIHPSTSSEACTVSLDVSMARGDVRHAAVAGPPSPLVNKPPP